MILPYLAVAWLSGIYLQSVLSLPSWIRWLATPLLVAIFLLWWRDERLRLVTGGIEGVIPPRDSSLPVYEARRLVEEQGRLFHVAITRPRRTLVLSSVLRLPRGLAHRMRARVRGGDSEDAETTRSTFLSELGPSCARAVRGEEWAH